MRGEASVRRGTAVLGISCVVALIGGCARTSTTAAPAAATRSGQLPGKFVWHDLVTKDPSACSSFYGSLLGWRFEQTARLGRPYVLVRSGAHLVGGIVDVSDRAEAGAQWVSYLSVPDVDRSVEQVVAAGGRVLVAPTEVGNVARAAVVADVQGAALGLAHIHAGDPPDTSRPAPGTFFWMEYLASDAAPALRFYKALAGFESAVSDKVEALEYHVLRRDRARAGLFQLPPEVKDVKPNWLPYVLVDDPAGLAAKVEALGGRVLLAPRPQIRGGSLAIVADPTGAALALQKWPI